LNQENKKSFVATAMKGGVIVAVTVILQVVIGFVTQVALTRMLAPEIFGQIVFAASVAMFFNAFTNLRGDVYVIQQKGSAEHAVDVAFTLELVMAVFFVTIVIFIAPSMMSLLGKSEQTIYVQILALAFLYNPLSRPRCILERELNFFQSKFPTILSQILASVLSVSLAYKGYGVWSLLCWRLVPLFGEVVILWAITPYRPRLRWDKKHAERMLHLTWPLIGSAVLAFVCYNIDYFIIGQFLEDGVKQLGYYWLGFQAAAYVLMARQVLHEVLFPIFSRLENDKFKGQAFLRLSQAVAGVFLLLTIFAVSFGRDIIIFIYGMQWEPAIFPFQIIFIVSMIRAIIANMGYYFYSSGNTRPEVIGALISSILLVPSVYFGVTHYGINGAAVAVLAVQIIVSAVVYEWYIRPMVGHGVYYFLFWPLVISGLAFALAYVSDILHFSILIRLLLVAALFSMAYFFVLRSVLHDFKLAFNLLRPRQNKRLST
jgi:teichuronic acid exporter